MGAPFVDATAAGGLEDLGPAAALRVVGPDREKWLQGMQSSDVAAAPHGGAIAGAFLSGKGRLVALGLLWRRHDEVVVTTEPDRLDALACSPGQALDHGGLRAAGSAGPAPLAVLAFGHAAAGGPRAHRRQRPAAGVRAPAPGIGSAVPVVRRCASARGPICRGVAGRRRRSQVGAELDEDTTPIEGGLDPLLSFSKGCYVGQEVVAMATYRGRVAWNLVRLEVQGEAPAVGTKLGRAARAA